MSCICNLCWNVPNDTELSFVTLTAPASPEPPPKPWCDPTEHDFEPTLDHNQSPILFCRRCGSQRNL